MARVAATGEAPQPLLLVDIPGAPRRALTTGILLVVTLVAFEALAVATILPAAREDLGGLRYYGWAFSAFLLASLVGIAWAGEQCDRSGPVRPFVFGLVLFGIGLAVAGAAPTMPVLVAGRAVQGLGAGVIPAVAYVVIGRAYTEAMRPRVLAWMTTAWVVPGLVGPGAAAAVAETIGWRFVFVGLLPMVVIAALLAVPGLIQLGAPADPRREPSRVPRALALAAGAALLLGGVTAPSAWLGAPVALGGAAIVVVALRGLVPAGTLLARRGLPAVIAGQGLLQASFFGIDAFVPFTLVSIHGESTFLVGLGLSLSALTWTAGTWLIERSQRRIPRRVAMSAGLVIVAAEALVMAFVAAPGLPNAVAVGAWVVGAFGIGMAYPSFSLAALAAARPGKEGANTSALKLSESLGAALGTGLAGAVIAAGAAAGHEAGGAAAAFALLAAMSMLGAIAAWRTN